MLPPEPEHSDSDNVDSDSEEMVVKLVERLPIVLSSGTGHDDNNNSGMDESLHETQMNISGLESRKVLLKLK